MATSFTKTTTAVFGLGVVTASVLSAAAVGSVITKGDLILDSTDTGTPSIVLDTSDVVQFTSTEVNVVGGKIMSGSTLRFGSGSTPDLVNDPANARVAVGQITPKAKFAVNGAMSGTSLVLNGGSSGAILCFKTNGTIGKCTAAVYGAGVCVCN